MNALLGLSRIVDAVNARIGRAMSWLILAAILVSSINAIVRKTVGVSSNSWLELQWVLFGAVFLLCSPWTLLDNEHIRIDVLNTRLPLGVRNAIELIGHTLFLLPLCLVMVMTSWPFFLHSAPSLASVAAVFEAFPAVFAGGPAHWLPNLYDWWLQLIGLGEQSFNAGGLPLWPAKFLVFLGFLLLFAQGISELIKRIAITLGRIPDPNAHDDSADAVEAEVEALAADINEHSEHR